MINITAPALAKIKDILSEHNTPNAKIRTFVQGGGCAGFNYGFSIDTEQSEDDFIIENSDNLVIVDAMSMTYLAGSTIDYKESLMGSNFVINNPNAETTCGCGSSFSL